jgi:hypothetical protein
MQLQETKQALLNGPLPVTPYLFPSEDKRLFSWAWKAWMDALWHRVTSDTMHTMSTSQTDSMYVYVNSVRGASGLIFLGLGWAWALYFGLGLFQTWKIYLISRA